MGRVSWVACVEAGRVGQPASDGDPQRSIYPGPRCPTSANPPPAPKARRLSESRQSSFQSSLLWPGSSAEDKDNEPECSPACRSCSGNGGCDVFKFGIVLVQRHRAPACERTHSSLRRS